MIREKMRLGNKVGFIGSNKGFTLIEMAIVLIIIGIIIGAVVKGKDLVRSGEQKKLYTTFLNSWYLAFNSYYDRTGRILGDTATDTNSAPRDGLCSNPSETNLNSQLTAVGLEAPVTGPTGSTIVRRYKDFKGRPATLTIVFGSDSNHGNYIQMAAIPNDLGLSWDRMIDGQMDGQSGNFLYIPNSREMATTASWPSADNAPVVASVAILKLAF